LFDKPALELARKRLFKGLLARNELVVAAFAVIFAGWHKNLTSQSAREIFSLENSA
jgi:hypothetical protein